jgi:hypothetical protein
MPADDSKRPSLKRVASYNAVNGREVSAYAPITGHRESIEGEDVSGWQPMAQGQAGGGAPSWAEWERSKCQSGTSIRKRPQG